MKRQLKKVLSRPVAALKFIQKPFKRDVLILVNRNGRDVLGLFLVYAYLKYVFKKRVEIKSAIYQKYFWIRLYQPQVVISVNIDCPSTVNCYKMMKGWGITCLMAPTEVFPVPNPKDLVSKYDFKNIVDGVFLPGEKMKEIYLNNGKIFPSQAFTIGFPTFDWTSREFREFFMTKKDFCRENNIPELHKLILFVSSFSMADYDMAKWEKECFHWPETSTKERAYELQADSKKARQIAMSSLLELIKKHPDWHILVRKHPVEDELVYEKLFSKSSQITFYPDELINDLVSASDVVIHWNSTVSAIAFGFEKPTILIDIGKEYFLDKEDAVSQKGNYICLNTDQIEDALIEIFSKNAIPKAQLAARKQLAANWFTELDGKASFRAAKLIAKFSDKNRHPVHTDMSIFELTYGIINSIKYIIWFWVTLSAKFILNKQKYSIFLQKLKKYDQFFLDFTRQRFENGLKDMLLAYKDKND